MASFQEREKETLQVFGVKANLEEKWFLKGEKVRRESPRGANQNSQVKTKKLKT
jgi:hypothetical protein